MIRLSADAFRAALKKGHGRARLHVLAHGDDGVQALLRDACVNEYAYDPQCEGGRADWMHEMVLQTKKPEIYFDAVKSRFMAEDNDWNSHLQGDFLARRSAISRHVLFFMRNSSKATSNSCRSRHG